MKKFEIGKTYSMNSACDHNCVWSFVIVSRTDKTVTIRDISNEYRSEDNRLKTCRINQKISEYSNTESIFPFGRYSMAPILRA